jgi:hypothetical protein
MRRDCECTLSHGSSGTNILRCPPIISIYGILQKEKERDGVSVLGEIDQGFGEAELPEHLVARDRPFARCVEEYVCLFLGVLVIVGNGAVRLEGRVVDG